MTRLKVNSILSFNLILHWFDLVFNIWQYKLIYVSPYLWVPIKRDGGWAGGLPNKIVVVKNFHTTISKVRLGAMKKGLKRLSGSMMQTWFSNKTTWLKFRCPKLSQIFPKVYIICTVWKPRKFELFWTNQFWWLVLWDDLSLFPHTFR